MHGPDGVDYPHVTRYFVVEPYAKLVYDHGGTDDTPPLFRVTATFQEEDGRTTLDIPFALASPEAAAEMAKFIKKVGGYATWDRLAEHLDEGPTGRPTFAINRAFDAPIARVFEMWTRPEQLVTSEPCGEVTGAEVESFVRERPGMTLGWTGSFDVLEGLIDPEHAA